MEFNDGILSMVGMYAKDKTAALGAIKKFACIVSVCNEAYRICVNDKSLAPIESLPFDHKNRLWRESAVWESRKDRIRYCRAKYLLETI
jgi:hypothetical protein